MTSLPPIDSTMLPADVRAASKGDQETYKAGLSFERQLVEQLAQTLADTTKAQGGDDADGGSAATQTYKDMLPGVLADSVLSAGGLGLARTIYDNLKEAGK
jgi:Rod binding domain-containing protein